MKIKRGEKKFALLLACKDSDYAKKMYAGYLNVFRKAFGEEGETWDLFRVIERDFPKSEDLYKYDGFVVSGSPCDAFGNDPWIFKLCDFLKDEGSWDLLWTSSFMQSIGWGGKSIMDTDDVVNVEEDMEVETFQAISNGNGVVSANDEMLSPPTRSFHSRDELLEYVRNFSISQGYATTIRDSKTDKYVTIGCDKGGTYRNRMNTSMEDRKRKTSSRLIDCSFRIKGVKLVDGFWILQTKNGSHNHEASRDMAGHPSTCRLSNEEILRVNEMSKSGATPSQALTSLVQANPKLKATNKTIYNVKAKIREEELAGWTLIQALMDELSTVGFKYDYKRDADNHLTHFFFSRPSSTTLSRSYPNVFVMDCTYKTNRFKMSLLDVIGVSSFNTSFYSCFGFLSKEEEEDYIWALTMFKKVLGTNEPTVIVSDRELALMNAIRVVFPRTTILLCTWHVEKNISANCKKHFEEGSDWETFILCWTGVIQSDSEPLFN